MCHLCNTKPVYEFTNQRKLCKTCFVHWFEKKFLYINRKFNLIQKGDVIFIKKGNGYQYAVLKYLLEKFEDKLMIKINNKKSNKTALTSTIDYEANEMIDVLINKDISKLSKLKPINNRIIKPLYLFTDEEVLIYTKIKRLRFTPKGVPSSNKKKGISEEGKEKKTEISEFIDKLEKKHPEVKRAVVNSYLKLNTLK